MIVYKQKYGYAQNTEMITYSFTIYIFTKLATIVYFDFLILWNMFSIVFFLFFCNTDCYFACCSHIHSTMCSIIHPLSWRINQFTGNFDSNLIIIFNCINAMPTTFTGTYSYMWQKPIKVSGIRLTHSFVHVFLLSDSDCSTAEFPLRNDRTLLSNLHKTWYFGLPDKLVNSRIFHQQWSTGDRLVLILVLSSA